MLLDSYQASKNCQKRQRLLEYGEAMKIVHEWAAAYKI